MARVGVAIMAVTRTVNFGIQDYPAKFHRRNRVIGR